MNKEKIKELALANGFKLKEQPDGAMDLNPYVFEFAAALERVATAELKAHVEALQKQKEQLLLGFDEYKQMQNVADAEIKAQAVVDIVNWDHSYVQDGDGEFYFSSSAIEQYANELRNSIREFNNGAN